MSISVVLNGALLFLKHSLPIHSPGELHNDKQRHDTEDRDGKAGESLKEKAIRKQHQIYKLRKCDLQKGKAAADNQSHVRDDKNYRDHGTDCKSPVNRNVIYEVGKQEVKTEKCGSDKKVVHRMNFNIS